MTLSHARKLLEQTFGVEPEVLVDQWVMAALPGGAVLRVKFIGLSTTEHDMVAVVRLGDTVSVFLVHPSRLSRVQR